MGGVDDLFGKSERGIDLVMGIGLGWSQVYYMIP